MEKRKRSISLAFEERKKLEEWKLLNVTYTDIALRLNRHISCVSHEYGSFEGRLTYCAKKAHESALERETIRSKKISESKKNLGKKIIELENKFVSIEMQIGILTELIRSFINDKENQKL